MERGVRISHERRSEVSVRTPRQSTVERSGETIWVFLSFVLMSFIHVISFVKQNYCEEVTVLPVFPPVFPPISNVSAIHFNASRSEREAISRMVNESFVRAKMSSFLRSSFFTNSNERCALNFYGLPRSFSSIPLHSIIENIMIPNAPYDCDLFVNYHSLQKEEESRSGSGGELNTDEILLLEEAFRQVQTRVFGSNYKPTIRFSNFTDSVFFEIRGNLVNKTRTSVDFRGNNIYLPATDVSYTTQTIENIIRMWHGQQSVWELMEGSAEILGVQYTRVGMFRSDLFYVSPIDILEDGNSNIDIENKIVVIPGFRESPVNDRMIVGPYKGVLPWASKRFELLNSHMIADRKGQKWGLHSEMFVYRTIIPAIERNGVKIVMDKKVCLLRVRPEDNIWVNERCTLRPKEDCLKTIELILNRKCFPRNQAPPWAENHVCPRGAAKIT